jgi:hypothetical protein
VIEAGIVGNLCNPGAEFGFEFELGDETMTSEVTMIT